MFPAHTFNLDMILRKAFPDIRYLDRKTIKRSFRSCIPERITGRIVIIY